MGEINQILNSFRLGCKMLTSVLRRCSFGLGLGSGSDALFLASGGTAAGLKKAGSKAGRLTGPSYRTLDLRTETNFPNLINGKVVSRDCFILHSQGW